MYKHLSLEEREVLYCLHAQKVSLRDIGKLLGRKHSTLGRELKRNTSGKGTAFKDYFDSSYLPATAQKKAERRACKQRTKAPLKNTTVLSFVLKHLTQDGWSPQTISQMLTIKYPDESITKETIYSYIYDARSNIRAFHKTGEPLSSYLTLARKKRMKLKGRRVQRHGFNVMARYQAQYQLRKDLNTSTKEFNLVIGKQIISLAKLQTKLPCLFQWKELPDTPYYL